MEWYDLIEKAYTNSCVCDDDCGSHGVGCDDDNEGWHSGDDE